MEKAGKFRRTFEKFEKAFRKFEEIVRTPELFDFLNEELVIEIATKRFEYTFESLWNVLKEYLRSEGTLCSTPMQTFKESFKRGLVGKENEELLSEIIEKRNRVVHIYGSEEAKGIYNFIKEERVYKVFKEIYELLKKIYKEA